MATDTGKKPSITPGIIITLQPGDQAHSFMCLMLMEIINMNGGKMNVPASAMKGITFEHGVYHHLNADDSVDLTLVGPGHPLYPLMEDATNGN